VGYRNNDTQPSRPPPPERPDPSQDFTYAKILLRLNPLIRGLLRSPLHHVLSGRVMLIDFEGRKSGRAFSIPVGYTKIDSEFIVLISKPSTRSWWHNFREPWPAMLTIRRKRQRMEGIVVEPGSPEFRWCFEETFRRHADATKIYNFHFNAERGLTDEQFQTLSRERGAMRFMPELLD
jgi:hypothetical protein